MKSDVEGGAQTESATVHLILWPALIVAWYIDNATCGGLHSTKSKTTTTGNTAANHENDSSFSTRSTSFIQTSDWYAKKAS